MVNCAKCLTLLTMRWCTGVRSPGNENSMIPVHQASTFLPKPIMLRSLLSRNSLGLLPRSMMPLHQNRIVASRLISLKPNFSKFKLKEQPPGFIVGTVNDAYKAPEPDHYHGSNHWTYDRFLAISLVPLTAVPFVMGVNFPMIDTAFCLAVLFHSYSGFKSCIIDYIPERVYGFWHRAAMKLLTLGSAISIYGIYVLETTENGLFDLVSKIFGA